MPTLRHHATTKLNIKSNNDCGLNCFLQTAPKPKLNHPILTASSSLLRPTEVYPDVETMHVYQDKGRWKDNGGVFIISFHLLTLVVKPRTLIKANLNAVLPKNPMERRQWKKLDVGEETTENNSRESPRSIKGMD